MKIFGKDTTADLVVIAEIGVNHEGDPDAAMRLVDMAAGSGADAVKFQTYTAERFISAADPERLARVKRFSLDNDTHIRLAARAAEHGIGFFSTPVTEDVVPFLDTICPAFKIASGDIDFEPVIRAAAATGKPMIVSTGAADLLEIAQAIDWVSDETGLDDLSDRLALLHCVSAYPVPVAEANVRAVPFLADKFGLTVGYSNHVIGPDACYAAVALGARIIEIHFTDCKEGRTFRDHELSMDPADMKSFVTHAKGIHAALGTSSKALQPSEQEIRSAIRKGIAAARDIPAGTVLSDMDLTYARPATEFPSSAYATLIGKSVTRNLKAGEPIPRDAVAGV